MNSTSTEYWLGLSTIINQAKHQVVLHLQNKTEIVREIYTTNQTYSTNDINTICSEHTNISYIIDNNGRRSKSKSPDRIGKAKLLIFVSDIVNFLLAIIITYLQVEKNDITISKMFKTNKL